MNLIASFFDGKRLSVKRTAFAAFQTMLVVCAMSVAGAANAMKGPEQVVKDTVNTCLLYTSPSPRDQRGSRMPSSA